MTSTYRVLAFFFISLLLACASSPGQPPAPSQTDGVDAGQTNRDAQLSETTADVPAGQARWTRPEGYCSIVFVVDDTANATYLDAEMEWNASLTYDRLSNIAEFTTSWLPDEGPYPPLYDDGPYTAGGHEAEGQTAGDSIFSAEVFFLAEETTTFDYGLINDLDHWIWSGPNGQVTVNAGETGTVEAQGFGFEVFGDIDIRVTLDTNDLHEEYPFDAEADSLFVKGSMISWRPIQLLDNGERGDEAANDGIYTLTLSEYLGPHDGTLSLGQEAQFVFVFFEAEGLEYKLGGNALANGVAAYSTWDDSQPGVFLEEELLLLPESRGSALNTAIRVGSDDDIIVPENDPVLLFVDPDRGSTAGGTSVELSGEGFATGATITFDEAEASCEVVSATSIECTTPAHAVGVVPVTVENPNGAFSVHELGFTYIDTGSVPSVDAVDPNRASAQTGGRVSVSGANFVDGATITFGDELATNLYFESSNVIWADAPPQTAGVVNVTVRNPDGQTGTLTGGFTYETASVDWAGIQWPVDAVTVGVSAQVPQLYGRVYQPGVTDGAGQGDGIMAELIYAPEGTANPSDDDSGWTALTMVYNGDLENDDEYMLEGLTIDTAGTYVWGVRFSLDGGTAWTIGDLDGSRNGFSLEQAGRITVGP